MTEEIKKTGRLRSLVRKFVITVVVFALLGAVLWLVAERNSRQWFLVPEDGKLVVKKGVLFLTGRTDFKTSEAVLAQTYSPLAPPTGIKLPLEQKFDDRALLDQGIYDLLSRWARDDIASEEPQRLERGLVYITRAELLPGISAVQREDLRKLRGESGFYEAKSLLDRGVEDLRLAREKLRLAADAPTRHAAEASILLRQLDPIVEEAFRASRSAASAIADKKKMQTEKEKAPSTTESAPKGSQ